MEEKVKKVFEQYPSNDTVYYTNENFFFDENACKIFASQSKTEVLKFERPVVKEIILKKNKK